MEAAENDTFALIASKLETIPPSERADDKTYKARLEKCKSCDFLISGVCIKCGCYVEFRAAYRRMKCPDVSNRKW